MKNNCGKIMTKQLITERLIELIFLIYNHDSINNENEKKSCTRVNTCIDPNMPYIMIPAK